MMTKLSSYFKLLFPFATVFFLWRLSGPGLNPCGILVLIPVFYYSFASPRDFFVPAAILGCLLLDYNFDTVLFWTIMYCLTYALNGFQSYVDITRQKRSGLYLFMAFYGFCLTLLGIWSAGGSGSFYPIFQIIWLFLWGTVLYIPFVVLAHKVDSLPQ
jgi:hypothetical protein